MPLRRLGARLGQDAEGVVQPRQQVLGRQGRHAGAASTMARALPSSRAQTARHRRRVGVGEPERTPDVGGAVDEQRDGVGAEGLLGPRSLGSSGRLSGPMRITASPADAEHASAGHHDPHRRALPRAAGHQVRADVDSRSQPSSSSSADRSRSAATTSRAPGDGALRRSTSRAVATAATTSSAVLEVGCAPCAPAPGGRGRTPRPPPRRARGAAARLAGQA